MTEDGMVIDETFWWNFISDRHCLSTNSGQEVPPNTIAAKTQMHDSASGLPDQA